VSRVEYDQVLSLLSSAEALVDRAGRLLLQHAPLTDMVAFDLADAHLVMCRRSLERRCEDLVDRSRNTQALP
jgi:hypothetical protein